MTDRYQTILLFGAPGSGKGTQGKILGQIPGFYHLSCGEVFRTLDTSSELGRTFMEYSSRGELVPEYSGIGFGGVIPADGARLDPRAHHLLRGLEVQNEERHVELLRDGPESLALGAPEKRRIGHHRITGAQDFPRQLAHSPVGGSARVRRVNAGREPGPA